MRYGLVSEAIATWWRDVAERVRRAVIEKEGFVIRIGSRGSQLALWQAEHIAGLLRGRGIWSRLR
jgi:hypothetical protein